MAAAPRWGLLDRSGSTPLHAAVANNHRKVRIPLGSLGMEGGTGPDDGPVMDGLRGQGTGLQVASRLIERGADVNAGAARLFGRFCVCDA